MDMAVVCSQGGRRYMEDSHCLLEKFAGHEDWLFGGIFDGHGGFLMSGIVAKKMPEYFLRNLNGSQDVEAAFIAAYDQLDRDVQFNLMGTTALSFFLKGNALFVANAGDCRLLVVDEQGFFQITNDHNTNNEVEVDRVLALGAAIEGIYIRLPGDEVYGLAVTRALGDRSFRDYGVVCLPEVFEVALSPGKTYIFASDGLWGELSNQEVFAQVKNFSTAQKMAQSLMKKVIQLQENDLSYMDNLTIMVMRA